MQMGYLAAVSGFNEREGHYQLNPSGLCPRLDEVEIEEVDRGRYTEGLKDHIIHIISQAVRAMLDRVFSGVKALHM